jgi:maltose O-acetyltransferase
MVFIYLWRHRSRARFLSLPWQRLWAKRVLHSMRLLAAEWQLALLRRRGAKLGFPVSISPCVWNGTLRNLEVGAGSFIGRAELHLHAKVRIGCNVIINDGVRVLTASHDIQSATFPAVTAPIMIGDYAWIATGAILMPGVSIGTGAVVGAGAVVAKDVPDYAICVGNPGRLLAHTRKAGFNYCPVRLVALFEAWLGDSRSSAAPSGLPPETSSVLCSPQ